MLILLTFMSLVPSTVVSSLESNSSVITPKWEDGGIDTSNGAEILPEQSEHWKRTEYISVSDYTDVSFDYKKGGYNIFWYDESKKYIKSDMPKNSSCNYKSKKVTVEGEYMRVNFYASSVTAEQVNDLALKITLEFNMSTNLIDTAKKGSITICDYAIDEETNPSMPNYGEDTDYEEYLKSINATPLSDVTFKLTRVVDETFKDGKSNSYYTKEGIRLPTANEVKNSLLNNDGQFTRLNTYTMAKTDINGKSSLSDLPLGLYLVQEIDEPKSVMTKVTDYLISLPTTSSDRLSWNYNVVTYPKTVNGVVLTYDANNGTGLSTSEPRRANKTEPLTENPFTNGSKVFLGWADNMDATTPDYYDTQDFTMPDHDKTIYAVWGYQTPIRYFTSFKYTEPWGLKLSFALLNPNTSKVIDYTKYDDYGIYVLPTHKENSATPSRAEVIVKGKKYTDFTPVSLTFNDGSTDEYLTTTYDEDIYTQNLADDIYTLTFITYKGRTFWGTVRNRCVEDSVNSIIENSKIGLTTYTEAEVRLAKAIKQMYEAEKNYYIKNSSQNIKYPEGKNIQNYSFKDGEIVDFVHSTSLRAIAPWGLKLQAKPQDTDYDNMDDYGCIVFTDTKHSFTNNPTYKDIINNENSIVFSKKDKTANYEALSSYDNMNFISCFTVGIYTYQLAQTDIYTCFYYIKDGKYYYDNVMKRNCYDIAKQISDSSPQDGSVQYAAKEVTDAMINLYKETYYYHNGTYPEI